MTRRCFVHVGSPKTGTTYLQSVLWASRDQLQRQGVTLPLKRPDHYHLSLNLRGAQDAGVDPATVDSVVERLVAAVTRAKRDVLITNEILAVAKPAAIADLLERLEAVPGGLEVHVVVTARDWQRQLPAEWQQFVKTRHRGTFTDFLANVRGHHADGNHRFWRGQHYADIAARWGGGLPPERVHVVTVPPAGAEPELLLERYCSVLGVDASRLDTDTPRGNPSLGFEQTELMRRVNVALGDRLPNPRVGYNRVAKFWFAEKVLAPLPGTRLALPADERQWWHDASRTMVEELRRHDYDVVGDLEELVPVPPPDAGAGDPGQPLVADDADLLALAVEGIAAALTQREEDLDRIKSLRAELREVRGKQAHQLREAHDTRRAAGAPPTAAGPDPVRQRARAVAGRVKRGLRRRWARARR